MPIKYIGSKRRFVGVIGDIAVSAGHTVFDGFTGTTRVAQELKRRGMLVTTNDTATYSKAFSDCYIVTNADDINRRELDEAIAYLESLDGYDGYFTQTFCEESRFVQPKNGRRVDAMRDAIESEYAGTWLYPILLTSLIEATDRVDSTTGVQMAYLKK